MTAVRSTSRRSCTPTRSARSTRSTTPSVPLRRPDTLALTKRNLLHLVREPGLLVFTVRPARAVRAPVPLRVRRNARSASRSAWTTSTTCCRASSCRPSPSAPCRPPSGSPKTSARHHRPVPLAPDGPHVGAGRVHARRPVCATSRSSGDVPSSGLAHRLHRPHSLVGVVQGGVLVLAFAYSLSWLIGDRRAPVDWPRRPSRSPSLLPAPAHVRQLGVRAGQLHAWVAPALRRAPTGHHRRERVPGRHARARGREGAPGIPVGS